jgi:hypothetical protein
LFFHEPTNPFHLVSKVSSLAHHATCSLENGLGLSVFGLAIRACHRFPNFPQQAGSAPNGTRFSGASEASVRWKRLLGGIYQLLCEIFICICGQ